VLAIGCLVLPFIHSEMLASLKGIPILVKPLIRPAAASGLLREKSAICILSGDKLHNTAERQV
jgi:hypothetical protein